MRVEHWISPGKWGWGKELNSQGQTVCELTWVKYQRLRAGSGWQANLPKELLAPRRDWEKHKGWAWGGVGGDRPTSQSRAGGRSWSQSLGRKAPFKTQLPHLAGGGPDQTGLQVRGNTAAAKWKQQLWPPFMNWQSHLTSQFQLIFWTEGTKYYSKASHLVRPHQSFHLYTNTRTRHLRNNSRTFTKTLNSLWFLNLVFFIVLLFIFFEF
jgi:hypothetical protein